MYVVYGKANCPYCVKAKELLDEKGLEYTYTAVDEDKEVLQWFKEVMAFRTVPQVFLGDLHIGGYTELEGSLKGS